MHPTPEELRERIAFDMHVPQELVKDKLMTVDYVKVEQQVAARQMKEGTVHFPGGVKYTTGDYLSRVAQHAALIGPNDFFVLPAVEPRSLAKHHQALRNSRRPGLSEKKRKHWRRRASKWGFHWLTYEEVGISAGNPYCLSKVRLSDG